MRRHVYPDYASQEEANRQYAGAINDISDALNYTGVVSVSSSSDVTVQFGLWLANATSGAITLTVPPARPHEGKGWTFKKTDASGNAVTIASASNIDGASSQALSSQYDSITIMSDGSVWHITAQV